MSFVSESPVFAAPHDEDARLLRANAEIARILASGAPLNEALARCAQTITDDLHLGFARIWTCDADDRLTLVGCGQGADSPAVPWTADGDRVLERVISLRRSYWAPNLKYALSEPALPWVRGAGMNAFAAFPLIHGARVYGAFAVAARGAAGTRLLCGLQSAAWMLALGIAQHAAEDTLARRTVHQGQVADLGDLVASGAPLAAVLDHAVHTVARGMGVEFVEMLELEPEGQTLLMRAGLGWSGVQHRRVIARDAVMARALHSGEAVVVEDGAPRPALAAHGVTSGVCVAIKGPHRPHGLIGAHARLARRYDDEDLAFLRAVAGVLGAAFGRDHDGLAPGSPPLAGGASPAA
jgi:GAF domain-containing protein